MSEQIIPSWDKKIVVTLTGRRQIVKLTSAEGKQLLTPQEARLAGRHIMRQQRIDAQKARLVTPRLQREAEAKKQQTTQTALAAVGASNGTR